MPNDIVERILMWKEIKDAQIIARETLANVFETRRQYDVAYIIMSERAAEFSQTYSVEAKYALNYAINAVDDLAKLREQAHEICRKATIMLQIVRQNI